MKRWRHNINRANVQRAGIQIQYTAPLTRSSLVPTCGTILLNILSRSPVPHFKEIFTVHFQMAKLFSISCLAGFRLGGSGQSQPRTTHHTKGLDRLKFSRIMRSHLIFDICCRCKARQTPRTLTSILATRSCQATKSRDGTKSSETFQGLLIFWVFVGF